jgi:anthranilate synthase component I
VFNQTKGNGRDAFYLFLDLVNRFGEGQVFLLEAAEAYGNVEYGKSIIGVCPLLDLCVKDGDVYLFVMQSLRKRVSQALADRGYVAVAAQLHLEYQSVIAGCPLTFRPRDPMAFLEDLRQVLREMESSEPMVPFQSGFLGYIGYDGVYYMEELPKTTVDDRRLPDIRLQWHAAILHIVNGDILTFTAKSAEVALDAETYQALLETLSGLKENPLDAGESVYRETSFAADSTSDEPEVIVEVDKAEFEAAVERARDYIFAGDIFQVVLSRRIRVRKTIHHYVAYERLRKSNPSPYMFMAEYPDMRLFGASPEVQFRAVGGDAEMKPIAGTSKGRGRTPQEDELLRSKLLADEKERAEHLMLVDLCRNDLGRVCEIGTVQVSEFMVVEPYSHLFHLVSKVRGRLRPDVSVFHALLATFPAGTLSGAPKIRAMEIIDELERYRRGPYGGLIGMIDFDANANTAIIIRTVVEYQGDYFVQVGAGIVADSQPELEWQECNHKARAVLDAITGPHLVRV